MSTLKPYPAYKASDVDWLGEIPADWSIAPLMSVAKESRVSNTGLKEKNLLSLSYGRIVRRDINSSDGLLPESFETYQIVERDDIVLRLTDLQNDQRSLRSGRVLERGIITSAYTALRLSSIHPVFASYLLRTIDHYKIFYSLGGGVRQSMKYWDVKRIPVAFPAADEQRAIADFLDRETAEIDAFIDESEKLITLLNERRTAVITQAVTKGLDPTVPMKDTGIEWLGRIPEDWNLMAFSRGARISNGFDYKEVEVSDGGYPVYGSGGEFRRASEYLYEGTSVLFGRKGTVNKPLLVSGRFWTVDTMFYSKINSNIWLPEFIYFWATMLPYELWSTSTALPSMTSLSLLNASVPTPSLSEQRSIVSHLQKQDIETDRAIATARQGIALAKERRQALISAAVTGKIDVRGAA